jgi:integrase
MIKGDPTAKKPRKPWARKTINKAVHQIGALFKWAASHEMLPAAVHQQLRTVEPLRRGRSEARETGAVGPIAIDIVEATKPFLSRQVKALVEVQLLTGARGGELFKLRPIDLQIDESKGVWWYRPQEHKTMHHNHDRVICFGPKAQAILEPFMTGRAVDAFMFSPRDAEVERRAAASGKRKTPAQQGNGVGTNRVQRPKRVPGDHYTGASYRRAIQRACGKAGVVEWHPHMLRHSAATLIRREFGLEAARIALGHSSALVTDAIYAERDASRVIEVMKKMG